MSFGPDKIRYRIGSRSGEIRWRLITRWMGMRWFLYRDSTKSKVKHVLGSYLDEETAKVAAGIRRSYVRRRACTFSWWTDESHPPVRDVYREGLRRTDCWSR